VIGRHFPDPIFLRNYAVRQKEEAAIVKLLMDRDLASLTRSWFVLIGGQQNAPLDIMPSTQFTVYI